MNAFTAPHCQDDEAARELIESIRWPNGPVCGHCGESERRYATKRPGRYRCGNPDCRKDYTATTGTVMESSHIPLHKWMMGFYLMAASKKGVSAHQLHRSLGVTYKSAWFMAHRIREAMRVSGLDPLGGAGKVVEADETYFGKVDRPRARNKYLPPVTKGGKSGPSNKRPIVALVKRGGSVRTFHVAVADKATVGKIVADNVDRESHLYTDESRLYGDADPLFAEHETVKHSAGEYVRGDVHTNTAEGYNLQAGHDRRLSTLG
jgi:transposase-like protein